MRLKQDKTLDRNLALLFNCSKIEEIYLHSLQSEVDAYVQYLDSKQGKPFKIIVERLRKEHFEKHGHIAPEIESTEQLLQFLPKEHLVPVGFKKDFEKYKHILMNTCKLVDMNEQLAQHHHLQNLARHSRNGTKELVKFMSSKENSLEFQQFCEYMQQHPASIINFKYSQRSADIAKKNHFYTPEFRDKLSSTLQKPQLGLSRDRIHRFFTSAKKLAPTLGLSALLLLGPHLLNNNTLEGPDIGSSTSTSDTYTPTTESTTPTENTYDNSTKDIDTPSITSEIEFIPPISPAGKFDTYGDAYEDFCNKLEQAYKYTTGESIDLSGLSYKNMAQTSSTIYIANYNGQTYRFSGFSSYKNNEAYLKKALLDAGATITTESSTITYISKDGKQSIAIADSNGNPVRSGNILEDATYGYQMYNQSYVKAAKKMLESQGIDTSNMSESELVGKYILSSEYNIQNEELSKILGKSSDVVKTIKNVFTRSSI